MLKIEELESKILRAIDEFHEENKGVKVSYTSSYSNGRISIKVTE